MSLQFDSRKRTLLVGAAALAIAMLAYAGAGASVAGAGGTDLSGAWNIRYLLSCSASLTQTGSDISGSFDCGDFDGTLEGTYSSGSRALSLTGSVEGVVPFSAEGAVGSGGDAMEGSFTAQPYVPEGTFEGERLGAGDASDLSGEWTLVIDGVFSGDCTADVQHNGSAVEISADCGPISSLEGTFSNGELVLGTTLFDEELVIRGSVSDDGGSIEGSWTVLAFDPPLAGVFLGERVGGPLPTAEDDDTPRPARTATPVAPILPGTGGGPSDSATPSAWLYVSMVLAGVALVLASVGYARRRQV